MKLISLIPHNSKSSTEYYFNEIKLLQSIDSEFIIRFVDRFQEDDFTWCIIHEFCEVSHLISINFSQLSLIPL